MKVYIGPYKNWYGPHQLAEMLCFWAKKTVVDEHGMKDYPDYVFKFGEWLAYGKWRGIDDIPTDSKNLFKSVDEEKKTVLYRLLEWIESKRDRKIKIRIDKYDTWSMDHTLALIALPMLKQLKETNHGSAQVDDEDLPEHMRLYNSEDSYYGDQQVFDFYDDPELCRQNIKCDIHDKWNWVMDEMIFAFEFIVDEDNRYSHKFDQDVDNRVANGLRLFGKYYQGLWD
jgi:hypothetical protein